MGTGLGVRQSRYSGRVSRESGNNGRKLAVRAVMAGIGGGTVIGDTTAGLGTGILGIRLDGLPQRISSVFQSYYVRTSDMPMTIRNPINIAYGESQTGDPQRDGCARSSDRVFPARGLSVGLNESIKPSPTIRTIPHCMNSDPGVVRDG